MQLKGSFDVVGLVFILTLFGMMFVITRSLEFMFGLGLIAAAYDKYLEGREHAEKA